MAKSHGGGIYERGKKMMFLNKSIDRYIKEFEEKEQKYYIKYQLSGSASALRTCEKYEDLKEICLEAKKSRETEDADRKRRIGNGKQFINNVSEAKLYARDKKYTIDDLLKYLRALLDIVG